METVRNKIARVAVRNRWISLGVALAVPRFSGTDCCMYRRRRSSRISFRRPHPFVKTYLDHPNFGNPLTVTMMVKRTDRKGYLYRRDDGQKLEISATLSCPGCRS